MKKFDFRNVLFAGRQGGMYFLLFLGVNFFFQLLMSLIVSYFPPGNFLRQNILFFVIYLVFIFLSIRVSIYSLKKYFKTGLDKRTVITASLMYSLYLVIYQLQAYLSNDFPGEFFMLQLTFTIISVVFFYFVSMRSTGKSGS